MKKIIILLFIILLSAFSIMADTVYEIDTEYGKEKVVIPDGYTEKDVLLKVAKAYYELNHDAEILKNQLQETTESCESYLSENKSLREKYNDLITDYDVFIKKLDLRNKLGWLKGYAGLRYAPYKGSPGAGISVGAILFNFIFVSASADYFSIDGSVGIGLGVGFLF